MGKKRFKKAKWDSLNYYELRESRRNQETKVIKEDQNQVKTETKVIKRGHRYIFRGEIIICKVLNKYGVKFNREKTFKSCKNPDTGALLRFDFHIPNRKILIEFDGNQHKFRLSGISNKEFVDQMKRDEIKNKWCEKMGYNLIRLGTDDLANIEKILIDKMKLIGES